MKKFAIALVSLVLVGVLAACGQSSKTSKTDSITSELSTKGTLTIGLEGTYQPYSYHKDGN